MDRRRQAGVFHEGESVGHAPRPTHFDFYLCSEITRPTDGFQLIELGKLSVVDGIKLTFDAKAASAHSNIIGANQGPATTSGYASTVRQTPRYSAPSRPTEWRGKPRFSVPNTKTRCICRKLRGRREFPSHSAPRPPFLPGRSHSFDFGCCNRAAGLTERRANRNLSKGLRVVWLARGGRRCPKTSNRPQ